MMEVSRIRAVKLRAVQVRDGDDMEEREGGRERAEVNTLGVSMETAGITGVLRPVSAEPTGLVGVYPPGRILKDTVEIRQESALLYLCIFLPALRAEGISYGVGLSTNSNSPSVLNLCLVCSHVCKSSSSWCKSFFFSLKLLKAKKTVSTHTEVPTCG